MPGSALPLTSIVERRRARNVGWVCQTLQDKKTWAFNKKEIALFNRMEKSA